MNLIDGYTVVENGWKRRGQRRKPDRSLPQFLNSVRSLSCRVSSPFLIKATIRPKDTNRQISQRNREKTFNKALTNSGVFVPRFSYSSPTSTVVCPRCPVRGGTEGLNINTLLYQKNREAVYSSTHNLNRCFVRLYASKVVVDTYPSPLHKVYATFVRTEYSEAQSVAPLIERARVT